MKKGMRTINGVTPFEQKWGERADEIAKREGTTVEAIFMRVRLYNSPYQRRAKPSKWERKYWKTILELCTELNLHRQTLVQREKSHGNVYAKVRNRRREYTTPDHSRIENVKPWLMHEHPDYIKWRSGVMFDEQE